MDVRIKRIYDEASDADGFRMLVDGLWPRGVSKTSARLDLWSKELAPSAALRRWYGHDPEKWTEFRHRYFLELDERRASVDQLIEYVRRGPVTLLYGSRETELNNAVALKAYIEQRLHP